MCPIKVIQTASRGQLSGSLSLSESARVSIHMYYILFFFYLLINNLLASLLSIFVEILFCKAKGQGPCH